VASAAAGSPFAAPGVCCGDAAASKATRSGSGGVRCFGASESAIRPASTSPCSTVVISSALSLREFIARRSDHKRKRACIRQSGLGPAAGLDREPPGDLAYFGHE
jgi:hypothetical protein